MLQNQNRSRYRNIRDNVAVRRTEIPQSRNYLKPTNSSLNRNRAVLSDVTFKEANKSRYTNTEFKSDYARVLDDDSLLTERKQKINHNNTNDNTSNLYMNNGTETTSKNSRNAIYKDNAQIITKDTENDDCMTDDPVAPDYNNYQLTETIDPLLPHYDSTVEAILDEAIMKYFKPLPDPSDEDTYDPVMVLEYNTDIFTYMRELEVRYCPKPNYISSQSQINWGHRTELLNWLIKVHEKFQLLPETLYLAVNIMDRFLSKKVATLNRFQLVGITALFIACKYEEIHCPTLSDIVYILDNEYTREDILQAERYMINTLNFEISWPGPMSFLRRISKADSYEYSIRTLSKYFLETTLLDPRLISSPPSWLAAGAYFLSRIILKDDRWSLKHCYYSGYTREQLIPLVLVISDNCKHGETKHNAIWDKYSNIKYHQSREVFDQWIESMPE